MSGAEHHFDDGIQHAVFAVIAAISGIARSKTNRAAAFDTGRGWPISARVAARVRLPEYGLCKGCVGWRRPVGTKPRDRLSPLVVRRGRMGECYPAQAELSRN